MRTTLLSTAAVALALTTVAATTASAGGNGAQRSGLSPQAGDSNSQCVAGSGAGTNGFAIVNAPGKPGSARLVNGEVSLKRGAPSTTYVVTIAKDGTCMPEGLLVTNGQGNGNAHLADATLKGGGTFYVVLQDASGNELFATAPVTVS